MPLLLKQFINKWLFNNWEAEDAYSPRITFHGNNKIIIQKTVNKCNNRCIFCVVPDCFSKYEKENKPPNTSEFKKIIDSYADDGKTPSTIAFTTAEPTLRPDIMSLLKYTTEKYPCAEIKMLTNGRMFSHKMYADSFKHLLARVALDIPLHGPNSDVHDKLTQIKNSFDQTIQGLRNIFDVSPKCKVNIRILLHRQNYKNVEDMLTFVTDNFPGINSIVLIYISMIGDAKTNHNVLFLELAELKGPLNSALRNHKNKTTLLLFHIPYCITDKEFWDTNAGRTLSEDQMEFPEKCSECMMRNQCCGFWKSEFNKKLFNDIYPIN